MDVDTTKPALSAKASPAPSSTPAKGTKAITGRVLGKQNQKRTLWKNAFDNPFTVSWDPISSEAMQQVIGALSSVLKNMPSRVRKGEHGGDKPENELYGELVVGLNQVTRSLEKDELRLVVCTRDLSPSKIIQHLPVLCAMRSVPLCPLNMTSESIAQLMGSSGIRTAICMGFKKTNTTSQWDEIVKVISEKCPLIDVPWVSFSNSPDTFKSDLTNTTPTNASIKTKRHIKLAQLKVRKTQHTAPFKPPKSQNTAPRATTPATKKPAAKSK